MKDVMFYKDYIGSIHYSTSDEVFFGRIEGIDDLISFEGSSVEELKTAFQEAVEDYLELCSLNDKEPQKAYKGSFNIRISPDLHRKAVREAITRGVSLNQFIEIAIKEKVLTSKG
ncbi:MAG: type II toxin-antitoxin system HicB family antitoxin [Clostridia bacterium]|jgi:predicted HicB family RNase H-like nuclease|nr:type II toxin-antitoxin system HicB family antitoxin [Clostridia bacterium]